jgi:Glycosyl transferases group 1
MIRVGYSPSIRLFEAAACARPIISDSWDGLDQFFKPGKEILVAKSADQILDYLVEIPDRELQVMGAQARARCSRRTRPPIARRNWRATRWRCSGNEKNSSTRYS